MNRQDRVFEITERMRKVKSTKQIESAWFFLSGYLDGLSYRPLPKFNDVIDGIEKACNRAVPGE